MIYLINVCNNLLFLHTYYTIDEQIAPYTKNNSSKQTLRTKKNRFGYKNFVLSSDNVYS